MVEILGSELKYFKRLFIYFSFAYVYGTDKKVNKYVALNF